MNWKKERDLLIAQTFAFVQSVTGKKPDLGPAAKAEPAVEAAADDVMTVDTVTTIEPPQDIQVDPRIPPIPLQIPRKIVTSEFRTEMQARLASFRAHQQRFDREREAHFSATLAKIRSAIGDYSAPLR
jgi:hypothetical protein